MTRSRHNGLTRNFCYMYRPFRPLSDSVHHVSIFLSGRSHLQRHESASPQTSLWAPRGRERGALSGSLWAFCNWGRGCEGGRVRRKGSSERATLRLALISASSCDVPSPVRACSHLEIAGLVAIGISCMCTAGELHARMCECESELAVARGPLATCSSQAGAAPCNWQV